MIISNLSSVSVPGRSVLFQGDSSPVPAPVPEKPVAMSVKKQPNWLIRRLKGRAIYILAGLPLIAGGCYTDATKNYGRNKLIIAGAVLTAMGVFRENWQVKIEKRTPPPAPPRKPPVDASGEPAVKQ